MAREVRANGEGTRQIARRVRETRPTAQDHDERGLYSRGFNFRRRKLNHEITRKNTKQDKAVMLIVRVVS
jgi:hypothetical protein